MKTYHRFIEASILSSLEAFPVVYIAGPRQSGKTTLVQHIAKHKTQAQYVTFDDIQMVSSAQHDPEGFLRSFKGPVVLDEIQQVPELFRPLKIIVDENRTKKGGGRGKFLLTGSASVMALPKLSDALVGRMVLHTLLPLSTQEVWEHNEKTLIDHLFEDNWTSQRLEAATSLESMMHQASFPELLTLKKQEQREAWCNGYLSTILQRDVHALMQVEKLSALPDMLQWIASRPGALLNESSLSTALKLNHITTKRYRTLLESLFLIKAIPAWGKNLGKRLTKSPKIYINDVNMLSYLLKSDIRDLSKNNRQTFGQVVENFMATELLKQCAYAKQKADLFHYRDAYGREVDFLLEGNQGLVIAIEVKASSKATLEDFKHIHAFQSEFPKQFKRGFVFYNGKDIVPFGQDCWAIPFAMLATG